MINLTLSTKKLLDRKADAGVIDARIIDAYVFLLEQGFDFAHIRATVKQLYPHFEQAMKARGFTGKAGSSLLLTGSYKNRGVTLVFIGLGDLKGGYQNVETYRRAMGQIVRIAETHKFSSITFDLPDPAVLSLSYKRLAQETSTVMHKASYHFDKYITNPDKKFRWTIEASIGVPKKYLKEVQDGVDIGICLADAINTARYWVDLPPEVLTPPAFAKDAEKLAKDYGLKSTIFDGKQIKKMGMGGLDGVARGSQHEPRLVILEYKAPKKKAPTIAIVGKGITFDTGGLSLKPPTFMEEMKGDMAGAAVILATMKVIAQLKPSVNVVAVAALAENMPSGTALKPGDIITAYNGKTIEVLDTDAEGRLVLADALSYTAKNYKPDAMIDLATLTGACVYALGPFYAGLLSKDEPLTKRVLKASEHSGDRVWRLPFDDDFLPAIASEIADMKNIGSRKYMAGARQNYSNRSRFFKLAKNNHLHS